MKDKQLHCIPVGGRGLLTEGRWFEWTWKREELLIYSIVWHVVISTVLGTVWENWNSKRLTDSFAQHPEQGTGYTEISSQGCLLKAQCSMFPAAPVAQSPIRAMSPEAHCSQTRTEHGKMVLLGEDFNLGFSGCHLALFEIKITSILLPFKCCSRSLKISITDKFMTIHLPVSLLKFLSLGMNTLDCVPLSGPTPPCS